ncbi:MAG: hypothetical protein FRX48_03291 [Lasallia pustulata]|uniref:Uncharacterized protein n=1 Tax=Lasallia pustulata TaxID=136370 RepID=A0A5M8PY06_9LECA|nr:MAG: hypothetical protein FRX48_03291 [Lasallia pustulata]
MEAASDAPQSTAVKGTQLGVSPAVSIPAPPGLSRSQDFPPLVAPRPVPVTPARLSGKAQSSSVASKTIPPIVPVLPKTPSRVASPMKEVKSDVPVTVDNKTSKAGPSVQEEASKVASKKAAVDASGSPQGKGLSTSASFQDFALDKRAPNVRNGKHKAENEDPAKLVEKRQHPGKLDITAAQDASKKDLQSVAYQLDSTKPETPDRTDRPSVLGHSAISRPSTPSTAVSRTDSPAPRATQPRTIRVLPTPKLESPRILFPAVAAMASSPTADKQPSRRGTPVSEMVSSEMVSDNVSITSTSMSRPTSPPQSKVGSAPVRQTTKSQQKKERQARAKLAEKGTKSDEAPVKEVEEEPVQAPIVGRKKKAKKAATEGTTTSTPSASRPPSPPAAENTSQEEVPAPATTFKEAPKEVKESKKGAKKEAMRAQKEKQQARESPTPPASTTSDQQQKSNLNAAAIIADLQKSGEILSSSLDAFKGFASFNQRSDITQAEIANFAEPPPLPSLTDAERQKLDQGEAICVPTPGSDRPTIILPDKQTVRGLTAEQADRYLTLRKQTMSNMGPSAFVGSASSSSRHPHGPFSSSFPADALAQAQRNLDEASTELVNRFAGPVGAAQAGPAMPHWTNAGLPGVADAMPEAPVESLDVEEAEQAMLAAKKETEALEKRLNVLMKRNRRLMFGSGLV